MKIITLARVLFIVFLLLPLFAIGFGLCLIGALFDCLRLRWLGDIVERIQDRLGDFFLSIEVP